MVQRLTGLALVTALLLVVTAVPAVPAVSAVPAAPAAMPVPVATVAGADGWPRPCDEVTESEDGLAYVWNRAWTVRAFWETNGVPGLQRPPCVDADGVRHEGDDRGPSMMWWDPVCAGALGCYPHALEPARQAAGVPDVIVVPRP